MAPSLLSLFSNSPLSLFSSLPPAFSSSESLPTNSQKQSLFLMGDGLKYRNMIKGEFSFVETSPNDIFQFTADILQQSGPSHQY